MIVACNIISMYHYVLHPASSLVLSVQGIREFWAGEVPDTGMGRKLQRALQFAEESNYDGVFEELSTMCTP